VLSQLSCARRRDLVAATDKASRANAAHDVPTRYSSVPKSLISTPPPVCGRSAAGFERRDAHTAERTAIRLAGHHLAEGGGDLRVRGGR
jgi:hypothetical protein